MSCDFRIGVISLSRSVLDDRHFKFFEEVFHELKTHVHETSVKRIILESDSVISVEEEEEIKSVDILVTDPMIFTSKIIFECLDHIRWIQMFTAGVDIVTDYFVNKPPPKFILTRNAGFFDMQMVQYVMGNIIARERLFQEFQTFQSQRVWSKLHHRIFDDLTIGIVGFGSVGRKIAEFALKFEMKVVALMRSDKISKLPEEQLQSVICTTSLSNLLESSDYVISILPNVHSTDGFFDGDVFKHCIKKKSVFMNIGRGNVVKEATIIKALNQGWLRHAILDVFEKEPLPSGSPLWGRGDITITPHISGSEFVARKFVKLVLERYEQFRQGKLVDHVVDWCKGY